jgi:hypothetical protein
MTHTQTIPNLIVIDKEWLLNKIKDVNKGLISSTEVLQYMFNNSYPLSPIVEDAWDKGVLNGYYIRHSQHQGTSQLYAKQIFLSQPIKLVK